MPCVYVTQGRAGWSASSAAATWRNALLNDRLHRSASDVTQDHDCFGYDCGSQRGTDSERGCACDRAHRLGWSRRRGRTRYRPNARAQAAAQQTQVRPVAALGRLLRPHDCKPFLSPRLGSGRANAGRSSQKRAVPRAFKRPKHVTRWRPGCGRQFELANLGSNWASGLPEQFPAIQ